MNRSVTVLVWLLFLVACNPGPADLNSVREQADEKSPDSSVSIESDMSGQLAYENYCSSCHDTGKNGAPINGNSDDWVDRSSLWEAVLFEHANAGYLVMPAKGGRAELTEAVVDAAAEYMVVTTVGNIPRD